MEVRVITPTGSITGTTKSLSVDPKMSVGDLKISVQNIAEFPHEQRGPLRRVSRKGISFDFSRAFLDGRELLDDETSLEMSGLSQHSVVSFGVGKLLGKQLLRAMSQIEEDCSHVGDNEILATCLQKLHEYTLGGEDKGGVLSDKLYDIFDTEFSEFENVHEGWLTAFNVDRTNGAYMQWHVEEIVTGSFPFKTFFGIPVYTSKYDRTPQHISGQPHPHALGVDENVASA